MLAKRIIPCLDIKDGQTVKGVNFINIRNVGDPVELGALYAEQGADELVFLDITATHEGRKTFVDLVKRIAREINIPFTVGGGISELSDADALLNAGADKISINSSAVRNPRLIDDLARNFGSQFVVLAIDARGDESGYWTVTVNGGRIPTEKELFTWAKEGENRGAGEILFTSMNHDGTKTVLPATNWHVCRKCSEYRLLHRVVQEQWITLPKFLKKVKPMLALQPVFFILRKLRSPI